jgi:hypothetical protein
MEHAIQQWKLAPSSSVQSIWERISANKHPVIEPKDKAEFPKVLKEYYDTLDANRGSVFFAVCRGKVIDLLLLL